MFRRTLSALAAFLAVSSLHSFAFSDEPSGQPTAAEKPFTEAVAKDLSARFPTAAAAEKAHYIRYTDEDETGAISYEDGDWTSVDARHPSQLWYDTRGKLLGADFSVPYDASKRPQLFGVDPARWQHFGLHFHYGLIGPGGTTTFGYVRPEKLASVGGDPAHPTAADLVKLGVAKNVGEVKFVFVAPAIWDLEVWTLPNANGAFAEKNPAVVPAHPKPMD